MYLSRTTNIILHTAGGLSKKSAYILLTDLHVHYFGNDLNNRKSEQQTNVPDINIVQVCYSDSSAKVRKAVGTTNISKYFMEQFRIGANTFLGWSQRIGYQSNNEADALVCPPRQLNQILGVVYLKIQLFSPQ